MCITGEKRKLLMGMTEADIRAKLIDPAIHERG
jgi:hypothetical protein